MSWDYAELSKMAKANGGPDNMMETYGNEKYSEGENAGRHQGRIEGGVVAAVLGGIIWGGVTIKKKVKERREKRCEAKQNAEIAKQEIIEGIKRYDYEQQEAQELNLGNNNQTD